jgi:hypothetical protein
MGTHAVENFTTRSGFCSSVSQQPVTELLLRNSTVKKKLEKVTLPVSTPAYVFEHYACKNAPSQSIERYRVVKPVAIRM